MQPLSKVSGREEVAGSRMSKKLFKVPSTLAHDWARSIYSQPLEIQPLHSNPIKTELSRTVRITKTGPSAIQTQWLEVQQMRVRVYRFRPSGLSAPIGWTVCCTKHRALRDEKRLWLNLKWRVDRPLPWGGPSAVLTLLRTRTKC